MYFKKLLIVTVLILSSVVSRSQESFRDTVSVSLTKSDSLFVTQNLALLAERCNIDAARAQVIQARLFKNLNFSITENAFNPYYQTMNSKKWFDFTDKGEMQIQVQKLFLLAGKRNKQIELAESGALKEEQLYFDLLRTLRYSLHSQFYNIYFLSRTLKMYETEINSLSKLEIAFENEAGKGLVSKKELLRIKATLFSMENERLGYFTQLIAAENEFNILMHTSGIFYKPSLPAGSVTSFSPGNFRIQQLIDTANRCRYDLKMAQTDFNSSTINLSYQKSLAVPDLTVSGGWDRNGSYYHNFNYVGLMFDLPFFDRNQGNIKSARFNMESSKYRVISAEDQVKADVISAFTNAVETDKLYQKFDKGFLDDLDQMNTEMLRNYEKKNISLIEFLDYYDAYKTNVIQYNNLMFSRLNSFENINFAVGKELITQ